ncbi:dephospho-CoA kinase [Roseinatronobacter bogoriensis]|uniref:Dephospho-CoA kinase n=1 Tax=Roseinatronobacter bogoriensis subsp. barguzinensis TaxID=441209 RepID=A0A2K8K5I8_9RHOB|nr:MULTISPECIES: dephospho-CoA kinase [Rhodobaca]ATX64697.1 dephospho-CoA kinase [Rhodobaca barguzinensis]MBB4209461.1 dephospho-CoA kinase [Rhodobaca bogoriensis DSM 18756]TDW35173.1 dephospho-CoA kinase [Rhodobaca barguzinensis]TDY66817.1 dephospho-CoA kinase [Rhodobaca bogoriensis DSM 18756]
MKRPYRLGLTGSIGMGKSTTAGFFRDMGAPVWDADAAVHRLYAKGGAAVAPVGALCPEAVIDGAVDRTVLKDWIAADKSALPQLESVVHPLVAQDREAFVAKVKGPLVVLDIPLLFETGAQVDGVLVVTAPEAVQRARVLSRPGMDEQQFDSILARQMPDAEKRARADFVIQTTDMDTARDEVTKLVARLEAEHA